jgi:hypothetical protein
MGQAVDLSALFRTLSSSGRCLVVPSANRFSDAPGLFVSQVTKACYPEIPAPSPSFRSWPILLKNSARPSGEWSRRKPDLSERPRIDDRASGNGQTTPDNVAEEAVGEFFNGIGRSAKLAKGCFLKARPVVMRRPAI